MPKRSRISLVAFILLAIAGFVTSRFLDRVDNDDRTAADPQSSTDPQSPPDVTAESDRTDPPNEPPRLSDFSDSSTTIRLFFSNVWRNDPDIGMNDPANIDRSIEQVIRGATRSIDCALFELESKRIADALVNAHARGVRVRIVAEADFVRNPEMKEVIDAGIPVGVDTRSAFMHNKFCIVDGEAVWTGSFNFTDNDAWRNNNHAVLLRSRELAENYTTEFREMFERKEFGPRSASNTPHTLVKLAGLDVYNYFSPEDDVDEKVYRWLRLARKRVRFMAFSMTDDSVGAILTRKVEEGVDVAGVVETRGSGLAASELGRLREAGADVATDANRWSLHHKVIVIDGTWTILGSYNFTESAARSNDENILIIKSPSVAGEFEKEYDRVRGMTASE